MNTIKIKILDIRLSMSKNNTVISNEVYEKCLNGIKNTPITYDDKVIGVMTSDEDGYLFADCEPEIIVKEMHKEGDMTVIDSFSFSAINISNKYV